MRVLAALGFDGEMATRCMAGADLIEWRMLRLAPIPRVDAAIAKPAAGRPGRRRWDGTGYRRQTIARFADAWHRLEQTLGVRMVRRAEECLHVRLLDHLAAVH